jgi:light-regulated signal transduction histidine kinase (bacteriophytochrome)
MPEISVSSDREHDFLVLYFSDNGLGMDLEKYGHKLFAIFNPKISIAIRNPLICVIIYLIERNRIFIWQNFSIEKSGFKRMHDHVEGAGIGLYTVKRMVEKHQGDIKVESVLGKGTTFKVRMRNIPKVASVNSGFHSSL